MKKRNIMLSLVPLLLLTAFLCNACTQDTAAQAETTAATAIDTHSTLATELEENPKRNPANNKAVDATMEQLVTNPQKYHGKVVRLIGVGNLALEENSLSANMETYRYRFGNRVWLELGSQATPYKEAVQYNGEYVIVEGVFDMEDHGHMGMFQGTIKNVSRYELWNPHHSVHSMIISNQGTYSYTVTDYAGRILRQEEGLTRQPHLVYAGVDVLGIYIQAGTGQATRCFTYYDLEKGLISESFSYVLAAKNGYLVRADRIDGREAIIVENIFDRDLYYREYYPENATTKLMDFAQDAYFNEKGQIVVTYLTGDGWETAEFVINLS